MLKVSENKRFLVRENGEPFFYLGDTAWELLHKLDREEAAFYLTNRSEKGFTVVQTVILAEDRGLDVPNAYGDYPLLANAEGKFDPAMPAENPEGCDYWKHVDYVIDLASSLGMVVGLLPTWGDKVFMGNPFAKGPEIFDSANARVFGRYVGARYKDKPNLIWILGGDRNPYGKADIWRAMAEGLREGDGGNHLITYHPEGPYSSSNWFHHEPWLDYHTIQSGHFARHADNYNMVAKDFGVYPAKPTFDGEPRYEGHSVNWNEKLGYFSDYDCRQAAYWSVFAGSFGHTYGHTSVWQFYEEGREAYSGARLDWREALDEPGAGQMQHLRRLMESRPQLERIPDQGLIVDPLLGEHHIRATRGESYAFVYVPTGQTFEVVMGRITGSHVIASWYNPRSGERQRIGTYPSEGIRAFVPPSRGDGEDWVLVIDDASQGFNGEETMI